jgi:hypothetical protein
VKTKAAAIFAAGLVAVAIVAAGIAASDQSDRSPPRPQADAEARSQALAAWKHKPVSILHGKSRPSDLPASIEAPGIFLKTYGIDLELARRAKSVNGFPLFVAPGTKGLCLLDASQTVTNCWQTNLVLNGDAMVSSLCSYRRGAGAVTVAGVVPDGIRQVVVHRGRLGNSTAAVKNNIFVAVLAGGNPLPFTVSWNTGGKAEFHSSGIPTGTKYKPCAPIP